MKISRHEIDQALIDVRRAYRLLHDYQRAAMDAVRYIGAQLGFVYNGGYGRFSDMLRAGYGTLDNWAWDTLNMVLFEFNFSPENGKKPDFHCIIFLASDTGYFEVADSSVERTDPSTFKAAETSATKLAFLLFRDWLPTFNPIFRYEEESREEWRRLFLEGTVPKYFAGADVFARVYDFAAVADEQSTDVVLDDLIQHAVAKGFALRRAGKAT